MTKSYYRFKFKAIDENDIKHEDIVKSKMSSLAKIKSAISVVYKLDINKCKSFDLVQVS